MCSLPLRAHWAYDMKIAGPQTQWEVISLTTSVVRAYFVSVFSSLYLFSTETFHLLKVLALIFTS